MDKKILTPATAPKGYKISGTLNGGETIIDDNLGHTTQLTFDDKDKQWYLMQDLLVEGFSIDAQSVYE